MNVWSSLVFLCHPDRPCLFICLHDSWHWITITFSQTQHWEKSFLTEELASGGNWPMPVSVTSWAMLVQGSSVPPRGICSFCGSLWYSPKVNHFLGRELVSCLHSCLWDKVMMLVIWEEGVKWRIMGWNYGDQLVYLGQPQILKPEAPHHRKLLSWLLLMEETPSWEVEARKEPGLQSQTQVQSSSGTDQLRDHGEALTSSSLSVIKTGWNAES